MSILEHGLPAHFFTRKRAALAGLCIGLTFLVLNEFYAKAVKYLSEPQIAPACYGDLLRAGSMPIPPRHTYSPEGRSIDDRQASFDLPKTTKGLAACTTKSCPKEGWREYRSAIF